MEEQAVLAAALLALARDALQRLPHEPWLHRKRLLAEHAEEDAELAQALDPDGDAGEAPPDRPGTQRELALRARALIRQTTDLRALNVLVLVAASQERHADELPAPRVPVPPGPRDPFILLMDGVEPDPIDEAIAGGERLARAGDAHGAAGALRQAARLDAQRTRDGDPWGMRPVRTRAA